jgi:hypothetical protein
VQTCVCVPAGKIAAIAVAACLLAVAGCGDSVKEPEPAAYAPKAGDVAWLRAYGLWSRRLRSDMRAAETLRASLLADSSGAAAFDVAVNRLATCANRYRLNVGVPPHPAWRRPAALALSACHGYTRAERLLLAAVGNEGGGLLLPGNNALSRADQTMTRANLQFEHSFVWNRPLPRAGGPSRKSRIDPLYSLVATPIARRPVEIRCWSEADWDKVLAEFNAWEPGFADPSGFVGSTSFGDSANLGPSTCELLDQLAYRKEYPGGSDQDDLASAVQILSHEIQHLVANGTEAETECYGLQALERVARGLGAAASYARELALRFWQYGYPTHDAVYHTQLCQDGRPLDAHPQSSRWP